MALQVTWRLSVPALGHVCQSFQKVPECGGDLCTANWAVMSSTAHWNLLPSLLSWGNKLFWGVGDHPHVLLVRVWHKPLAEHLLSMKHNCETGTQSRCMVTAVHPAQCWGWSGAGHRTSCIHQKSFLYPPEVLLLPSCQDFALHHLLGHSENFLFVVGLSLGFDSRLHFQVQEFWFSAAAAALSLPPKKWNWICSGLCSLEECLSLWDTFWKSRATMFLHDIE